jgi:predicted secreted protein
MKKLVALAAVAIFAMFMMAGCAKEVIDDKTDSGQGMDISVNEEFVIALGFDPGIDFTWYPFFDTARLEQVGDSIYKPDEKAEIDPFNASGSEHITFKALTQGETQITIVYAPSGFPGDYSLAELVQEGDDEGIAYHHEIFAVNIK